MATLATSPLVGKQTFEGHFEQPANIPGAKSIVLLKAEGLKMAFGGQVVLDGIDLALRKGEVVLLRGENGSGKTTLLNILTGNLEPDAGSIHYLADGSPRTYHFPRRWWQELNPFDHFAPEFVAREEIGRTWQDVRLFGAQSLRDNIAVAEPGHPGENPLRALFMPKQSSLREAELNREAVAMLARFGLAGREDSSADKVSLGQSKRVAIARAVAAGAKVLFLDEPLAGLDRLGIIEVLSLLEVLVRQHQLTLVIVEHTFNHYHLHGLVTSHWLLEAGKLRIDDCTIMQKSDNRSSGKAGQRPEWFHLLTTGNVEVIDEPLPHGALLTRIRRLTESNHQQRPVLELSGVLTKRGSRTVIGLDDDGNPSGFNLALFEGEIAILQAPNGWGKSTLLAAICGLHKIDQGEILLKGQSLTGLPTWERVNRGLSALPSDHNTFPNLKTGEVLKLAGVPNKEKHLDSLANRVCSSLSGGEKQRVGMLTQTRAEKFPVVRIFDEPFAALDASKTIEFITEIAKHSGTSDLILLPFATNQGVHLNLWLQVP